MAIIKNGDTLKLGGNFSCGKTGRTNQKYTNSISTRGGVIPKVKRFVIINELSGNYPIAWLIEIAQVT
ncbi:hypothetical protein [Cytobacillus firmus]|uniref:hypothetical protein n=1 Tax=Cytobacillus firmus TaxID=1399 RepID=UPI0018CCA0A9|nr:hypothetical protein [Cytobacillus firmus]MBG9587688.1 hypothetical protein [Cytobacillus firmus]